MRIIGLVYFVLCGLLIESALGLRARDTEESETGTQIQISQISPYDPGAVRVEREYVIPLGNPDKRDTHNPETHRVEKEAALHLGMPDKPSKTKKKKKKKKYSALI
eukprot:Platyproteum_vivax@DN5740_c0_g1_i1.p1